MPHQPLQHSLQRLCCSVVRCRKPHAIGTSAVTTALLLSRLFALVQFLVAGRMHSVTYLLMKDECKPLIQTAEDY